MKISFIKGLPEPLRRHGAALYWEAFGAKLGRVLGPDRRALTFFERVILADHCVVAIDARGNLLGLAGFKSIAGSFAGGSWSDLRAVYGLWGGFWRGSLLWALSRDVDNERFLVDGICVASAARGQGIGTALLAALYQEAMALYEREGFVAMRTDYLGLLRHVFGFASSTTMVRPLSADAG
jgi:GNAT superfamily N-acetyltransferase